jgi:hypothetical protein
MWAQYKLFFAKTFIIELKPYKQVLEIEIEIEILLSPISPGSVHRCAAVRRNQGRARRGGRILAEVASRLLSL